MGQTLSVGSAIPLVQEVATPLLIGHDVVQEMAMAYDSNFKLSMYCADVIRADLEGKLDPSDIERFRCKDFYPANAKPTMSEYLSD